MRFSTRVSDHIRSNVWGIAAMFVALTGTAYAVDGPLPGQDQVGSADIIDGEVHDTDIGAGQVKNADLAANAVNSAKVNNGTLTGADLAQDAIIDDALNPLVGSTRIAPNAVQESELSPSSVSSSEVLDGSLTGDDIAPNAIDSGKVGDNALTGVDINFLTGLDVADGSLKGADVDEATLSPLDGHDSFDPFCDPGSTAFVTCDELTFTLGRRMQVLTTFTYGFGSGGEAPSGACATQLDGSTTSNEYVLQAADSDFFRVGGLPVVDVVTLDEGTHTIALRCKELNPDDRDIVFHEIRLAAVELGMD